MTRSDRVIENPFPFAKKTLSLQPITGREEPKNVKLVGTLADPRLLVVEKTELTERRWSA